MKRLKNDISNHKIHFVEYDGSWGGFQKGNPGVLAEEVSERLVTARAIESILGIEAENFEYRYEFKNGEIKEKLEEAYTDENWSIVEDLIETLSYEIENDDDLFKDYETDDEEDLWG